MESKKKEDLRIRKTKKNLYDSLIQLLKDNPFETIKVSDICSKAMVNRSTFYDHFNDKFDLLNSFIYDLQSELSSRINDIEEHDSLKDYYIDFVKTLLDYLNNNIKLYSSILKNNSNSIAYDLLQSVIYKKVTTVMEKHYENKEITIPIPICIAYYVPAVINVCFEYINNPELYTEEEIITYLKRFINIH